MAGQLGEDKSSGREWCLLPVALHELYHSWLASYALARHGNINQLKGVVHECTFVLWNNINPFKFTGNGFARLNPNSRDVNFDVLLSSGTGIQLKDTVSRGRARATALRVATYPGAVLGTPETVEAVAKYGVKIGSSGVSTAHNEAVAARAAGTTGASWAILGRNLTTGAAVGASVGVGIAVFRVYQRHQSGEGSWQRFFDEALRFGMQGGAVGGAGALAGTVAAAVLPAGNIAIVGGLAVGITTAYVISKVTDEQWAAVLGGASAFVATVTRPFSAATPDRPA